MSISLCATCRVESEIIVFESNGNVDALGSLDAQIGLAAGLTGMERWTELLGSDRKTGYAAELRLPALYWSHPLLKIASR
jgi:hypothetical protein